MRLSLGTVFVGAALLALANVASAAAPKLTAIFPPSVGRGQSTVVEALGEFSDWPPQVWLSRASVTVLPTADKGKLQVTALADAVPGLAWLRLYNSEGASSLRPLVIGHFAESVEEEPNDKPGQTKVIELPRVAVGRLAKRGDADCFRVHLKKGEQLVADVQANYLLGSPVDAIVQVCQLRPRSSQRFGAASEDVFVLEENHDATGIDPRVVCTAPTDGDYLVRVFGFPSEPDSGITLSGKDNYIYRLTLTTGPFIEHSLPSAVARTQSNSSVRLFGQSIADSTTFHVNLQNESLLLLDERSAVAFHPQMPGEIPLAIVDHACILADENSSRANPQEVPIPVTISGRLNSRGDSDAFRFALKKDDKLRISVQSRAVGALLYPAAQLFDSTGKTVANYQADRTQRDFSSVFTSPADGTYVLNFLDAADAEGDRGFYRLTLEPVTPDFALTASADNFVLSVGTPLEIPIAVDRRDGLAEPTEIHAEGLPPGVTAEAVSSQPQDDTAKQVKLILKSDPAAAAFNGPVIIRGKSIGPLAIEHAARCSIPLPGAGSRTDVWLTVKR